MLFFFFFNVMSSFIKTLFRLTVFVDVLRREPVAHSTRFAGSRSVEVHSTWH